MNLRKKEHFSLKSKKGNAILESLMILLVIILFSVTAVLSYSVFDSVNTDIQTNPDSTTEAKEVSGNLYDNYSPLMDNLVLFAFVLLIISVLVSTFMVNTHPIFFVVSLILLIFVFIIAMLLGNFYEELFSDSSLSAYANQFTYTTWLMTHIVELIIGVSFGVMVAMFIKFKS